MKRTNENLKKYHLKKGFKKFQNADIKHITFNMELDKVWHDSKRLRVYTLHNSKKAVTAD